MAKAKIAASRRHEKPFSKLTGLPIVFANDYSAHCSEGPYRQCVVCSKRFERLRVKHDFCSTACRMRSAYLRRKAILDAYREGR
jgi:predicted nucleic acid-binding Zn ribbon protein